MESENSGLGSPITGVISNVAAPVFAVFDGMGGEKCGEVAAYLAAKAFDEFSATERDKDLTRFLNLTCTKMNTAICEYAESNQINRMGTTAVLLAFGKKKVCMCNIGDSKAFLRDSKSLTQISYDHIVTVAGAKKPPLSQHLGIPEKEFVIAPYISVGEYSDGDRYLICSDGLTDMVSLEEIDTIIAERKPVEETAAKLMKTALLNGGTDNITIILCELNKKKFFKRTVRI